MKFFNKIIIFSIIFSFLFVSFLFTKNEVIGMEKEKKEAEGKEKEDSDWPFCFIPCGAPIKYSKYEKIPHAYYSEEIIMDGVENACVSVTANGVVKSVDWTDMSGSGVLYNILNDEKSDSQGYWTVVVTHSPPTSKYGQVYYETHYAFLREVNVEVGQKVKKGDGIGRVGYHGQIKYKIYKVEFNWDKDKWEKSIEKPDYYVFYKTIKIDNGKDSETRWITPAASERCKKEDEELGCDSFENMCKGLYGKGIENKEVSADLGTLEDIMNKIGGIEDDLKNEPEKQDLSSLSNILDDLINQLFGKTQNDIQSKNQSSAYQFSRNLSSGSSGEDVKMLQKFLNDHGNTVASSGPGSPGNETNYFGPATKTALSNFQRENGIFPASGYFGPKTREFINSRVRLLSGKNVG